jgi:hypothetical protein
VEEVKKHAEECRKLAEMVPRPQHNKAREEMAQTWEVAKLRQRILSRKSEK